MALELPKSPDVPELHREPIKQQAWYLQIKDEIPNSKRPIDKMSIAEILEMYQNNDFVCDDCGSKMGKMNCTLKEHIAHVINPIVHWSCEDCIIQAIRNGRVIASTATTDKWKLSNR